LCSHFCGCTWHLVTPDTRRTTLPAQSRLLGNRVKFVVKRTEARTGRRIAFFRTDRQGIWTGLSDCNERPVLFLRAHRMIHRVERTIGPMDTHKLHRVTRAQEGWGTSVARFQAIQEGLMDER
jgi:hypothetical protein